MTSARMATQSFQGMKTAATIWFAVVAMVATAAAAEPSAIDAPLPPSISGIGSSARNANLAPSSSAAPSAAGSSTRSKLRSLVSRMAPEETPPPPPAEPPMNDAGPVPAEPEAKGKSIRIPVATGGPSDRVQIKQSGGRISLSVHDVPLNRFLMLLGQQLGINIVCADHVSAPVSVTLTQVPLDDALTAICSITGCCWVQTNGVIYVSAVSSTSKLPAEAQGRQFRVFRLDYAAAKDVDAAVKSMLSAVGQSFVTEVRSQDNRRTQEVVAVQDLPAYLRSIEQCVTALDRAPRQVLIEAHVMQIDLKSDNVTGVNFSYLFSHLAQAKISVQDFATTNAPGFLFTFDGTHLTAVVEALCTESRGKSLASPKVLVLNGQEAKFQIGKQLGYRVTTTTETSTMQSVNFLDTGKILKVTPRITADNQVLLHVKPEVSDGFIDSDGLPQSNTTQVETDVMLPDGRGMVLGGLIEEKDNEEQQKVPFLGDLWLVGRMFQRRQVTKERVEIIICLVPRIVPERIACDDPHAAEVLRGESPLLNADLKRLDRPADGKLPDAVDNPWRLKDHLPDHCKNNKAGEAYMSAGSTGSQPYYANEEVVETVPQSTSSGDASQSRGGAFAPKTTQPTQTNSEPSAWVPLGKSTRR